MRDLTNKEARELRREAFKCQEEFKDAVKNLYQVHFAARVAMGDNNETAHGIAAHFTCVDLGNIAPQWFRVERAA